MSRPILFNQLLVTLFLCGDVMTGRGIDQVLPTPSDPALYEPYVKDARGYVHLAERAHGPVPAPVGHPYVWGFALEALEREDPEVRLINLETAVTVSPTPWPGKGIHYRMHPENLPVLTVAGIDVAALANNHVLDWGRTGLAETLETLQTGGIRAAGAGLDADAAHAPAVLELPEGRRMLVFAYGLPTSGIPPAWDAQANRPGVALLPDLSPKTAQRVAKEIAAAARPGDLVTVSLHWGGNWGFAIPEEQRRFARQLIDDAGVDVIHGHSSHHVKGIEVYRGRPILYGCGDLITDYEGIGGKEAFRGDLGLLYFLDLDPKTGQLAALRMVPTKMQNFRLTRPSAGEVRWLRETLNLEGERMGTRVEETEEGILRLRWEAASADR